MAIPQHTIDQILDRVDIVDLISQRVKLKKTGRTYSGCCPFHQEKTPSFHVYRDKAYYHCFGCQANGNAIRFLMDLDNRNFIDVIKDLAQQTGIELPKDDFSAKKATYQRKITETTTIAPSTDAIITSNEITDAPSLSVDPFADFYAMEPMPGDDYAALSANDATTEEHSLYDLLEQVTLYYQKQLSAAPHAQNYFHNRALNENTITTWRLGYAPADWNHLEKAFPLDIEGLKLVGLIRENDSGKNFDLLRDRVIFPIRDSKGRVVGFGGRALNDEIKPKYINSPDSEVFHKNQLLYGLYEGRKNKSIDWLMVEGYMDVIALHQAGITGAVATLGTASNTDHLNILFKQNPRLTLAFDGDAAGQKAAWRTLEIALPLLNDGRELRFFILPDQHDPDSLIRQLGLEQFQQLLNKAPLLSDYLFAQLTKRYDISHPEGKGMVMAELRQLTNTLPNGSYKYLLSQSFRERLGFGRKKFDSSTQDKDLSFDRIDRNHLLVALLMHYPLLFPHFETLRAFIPSQSNTPIRQLLDILDKIYDTLPKDIELSRYFALGAAANLHGKILPILNQVDIEDLQINHPEELDKHAQSLFVSMKIYYLKLKLKHPASVKEAHNLKKQLNDASRSLTELQISEP
ncbi:DNA primase [Acinetobacter qingfengensis]|uniref:DNA primase n=1 Tax=Acinetobacter qingfengensis TaxID=1262585 RepID=A0A1E7RFD0_9GAMM|nr:CHC2 zinc finger domain-containing protein [Acinetobacter qingfengensis]KAA8732815.1 DNA primase [Acinetobacter qingfengensis]OEY98074.1 DNA primase [Acinetobacter qingfengensis]